MAIGDADPVLLGAGSHWDNLDGYTAAAGSDFYPITFLVGFVQPAAGGLRTLLCFSDSEVNHYMRIEVSAVASNQFSFAVSTDAGAGPNELFSIDGLAENTPYLVAVTMEDESTIRAAVNHATATPTGSARNTANTIDSLWIANDRGLAIFEGTLAVVGVSHDTPDQATLNGLGDTVPIDSPGFAWEYLLGFEGTTLVAYVGDVGDFTETDGENRTEPGTYDAAFEALGWPPSAGEASVDGIGNCQLAAAIRSDGQKHVVGVA